MKIISGAQTGADQGALEAAEVCGIETGGFVTEGCMTEAGERPDLVERFGLTALPTRLYQVRTERNVLESDATVVIGKSSKGSNLTRRLCLKHKKRCINIPFPSSFDEQFFVRFLAPWIVQNGVTVLNVAGNRESHNKGIQEFTRNVFTGVLSNILNKR